MNPVSKRRSLPKAWPKNVKMTVLRVIALAHTAIVQARSIALNSTDARTRRARDLQGTLDEIAMLEEELRIKDGRMAMIDPHRRPYYRPTERMAILELRAARGWFQAETAKRLNQKHHRRLANPSHQHEAFPQLHQLCDRQPRFARPKPQETQR